MRFPPGKITIFLETLKGGVMDCTAVRGDCGGQNTSGEIANAAPNIKVLAHMGAVRISPVGSRLSGYRKLLTAS